MSYLVLFITIPPTTADSLDFTTKAVLTLFLVVSGGSPTAELTLIPIVKSIFSPAITFGVITKSNPADAS